MTRRRPGSPGLAVLWTSAFLLAAAPLRAQTKFFTGDAAEEAAAGQERVVDLVELRPGLWGVPARMDLRASLQAAAPAPSTTLAPAAQKPPDPRTLGAVHAYRTAAGLVPRPGMLVDITVGDPITVHESRLESSASLARRGEAVAAGMEDSRASPEPVLASARFAAADADRLGPGLRRDPAASREEAAVAFDASAPRKPSAAVSATEPRPGKATAAAPTLPAFDSEASGPSPRRVKSLRRISGARWLVNGLEPQSLGFGSSKAVYVLPGNPDAAVKIFEPLWRPADGAAEMARELKVSRALEALRATPRVLEHGSLPGLAAPVGYLVVEKVHGLDFTVMTRTKIELAAELFGRLAEAGVWIGDEGKLRANLMAGRTAGSPGTQAWLVDADAAVLGAGRPKDLARRYRSILDSWSLEVARRAARR